MYVSQKDGVLSLVKVGQSEAPLALDGSSDQFMYDGARDDTRPFDAAEGKVGPRVRFPPSETDSPNMAVTEQQRRGGREREEIGIRFRSPSRLGSFSFTLSPC